MRERENGYAMQHRCRTRARVLCCPSHCWRRALSSLLAYSKVEQGALTDGCG